MPTANTRSHTLRAWNSEKSPHSKFRIRMWCDIINMHEDLELTEYRYRFGSYSVGFSLFATNGWSSVASPVNETKLMETIRTIFLMSINLKLKKIRKRICNISIFRMYLWNCVSNTVNPDFVFFGVHSNGLEFVTMEGEKIQSRM